MKKKKKEIDKAYYGSVRVIIEIALFIPTLILCIITHLPLFIATTIIKIICIVISINNNNNNSIPFYIIILASIIELLYVINVFITFDNFY